jgi:hypothetical protein
MYGLESAKDPKLKPTLLKIKSDYLNKQKHILTNKQKQTKKSDSFCQCKGWNKKETLPLT